MTEIGAPGWRPDKVHPLADIFPMMSEEEIADLAADIKTNGLLHPIAIDDDGTLIDGRNRLLACEKGDVEPQFVKINGHDIAALIVSANLSRRNLTKSQQAIALAMIYPEPAKVRRKGSGASVAEGPVTAERLSVARAVLRHSRALASDVMNGRKSLDAVMKQVAEEQEASASVDAQLAELRRGAPDLADLVDEERLPLTEALYAMKRRIADAEAAEANKRETMLRLGESAWQSTTAWASEQFVAEVSERLDDENFRKLWLERLRLDPKRVVEVQRGARAFAATLNKIIKGGKDVGTVEAA